MNCRILAGDEILFQVDYKGEAIMGWVKIESWHLLLTWTRVPGRALTVCGLIAGEPGNTAVELDDFPRDEKTCENCLRLDAMKDKG